MIRDLLNKVVTSVRGSDRKEAAPARVPRADLEALEREAAAAPPQRRPQLYNRLGDLHAKAGDRGAALKAYGLGIDGYLENGFYDAAAALCRKMIEYHASVVRARCTLAFLSLGKELIADAQREIRQYVEAARRSGVEEYAIQRLHLMAEATDSIETRILLGEVLMELGDSEGADRVLGAVHAERNELVGPPMEEQRERWARLLRVAITDTTEESPADRQRRPKGL